MYGSIEPGDPVDYALVCALPATAPSSTALAPMSPPGAFVPAADPARPAAIRTGYVPIVQDGEGPIFDMTGVARTVYLNRNGGTLSGGYDDAAHNVSSVVAGTGRGSVTLPKANFSDKDWLKFVSCVSDEFSRFNIQIVQDRPAVAGFMMQMVGGSPSALGLPQAVGGIAPIDKNGCAVIEGAVTFIFPDSLGGSLDVNCEAAAQEIAHAFSLDHELLASDPMTYLDFGGHKVFQDQDASCGESKSRGCICKRPQQNSVKILSEKAGLFQDANGPMVALTSPADGASLSAGALPITVHATSATGSIDRVTLHYHDAGNWIVADCAGHSLPCRRSGDDFTFTVPGARGLATFHAEAADSVGGVNVTHTRTVLAGVGENPDTGAIRIAVSVNLGSFAATRQVALNATITTTAGTIDEATVLWTDRRGATSSNPMCPAGAGTNGWTRSIQAAPTPGERSFVVEADDSEGNHAASARFTILLDR